MEKQRLPNPPADIMVVLATIAAIFFLLAFGGKAVEAYRVQRYNAMLRAELAALQEEQRSLEARLQYVGTPGYVEEVAREQYKWVRSGEKLIIPVFQRRPTVSMTSTAVMQPEAPVAPSVSHWPEWLNLLKGKR